MATLQSRPALFNAVGGFLPNPIEYILDNTSGYETLLFKDSGGTNLFTKKQAALTDHPTLMPPVVISDIANQLAGYFNPEWFSSINDTWYYDADYVQSFYLSSPVNDSANVLYAVNAKLDSESGDMDAYSFVEGDSGNDLFLTDFEYLEVNDMSNFFVSLLLEYGGLTGNITMQVRYFDNSGSQIDSENIILTGAYSSRGLLRIPLPKTATIGNVAYADFRLVVGLLISAYQKFKFRCVPSDGYVLGWINQLGGFDQLIFDGISSETSARVKNDFYTPDSGRIDKVISRGFEDSLVLRRGGLSLNDRLAVRSLFSSERVFMIKASDFVPGIDNWQEVFVDSSNIPEPIESGKSVSDVSVNLKLKRRNS